MKVETVNEPHDFLSDEPIVIRAFYRFVPVADCEDVKQTLLPLCREWGLKGTILLASEGINSTIAGPRAGMDQLFAWFDADARFAEMEFKEHVAEFMPFQRMKIRLKQEIVRLAYDDLDMENVGDYIRPEAWDDFIAQDDVVVIDTRNDYEVQIGTFKGAVNPKTADFRSLPQWVTQHLDPQKHRKVAMFCTGGIRCEKSTALLKQMGFPEVYHLKGGILQYLEDTKNKNGMWQGDCFVFDDRVAVDAALAPAQTVICRNCSTPVEHPQQPDNNHKGVICGACQKAGKHLEKYEVQDMAN